MMKSKDILDALDKMIPNPHCELEFNKDYELLIAIVLSAQSTDVRVNKVTPVLWNKYDIFSLSKANQSDIEDIIHSVGTYRRKSEYIIEIANRLVVDYNGIVPIDQAYLEKLPGVGHKTANVFLSEMYNKPVIAVDTHVTRVSKRLGIAKDSDDVIKIEHEIMDMFPKDKWARLHLQLVLFGRYICKAKKPECNACLFNGKCKETKK